MSKNSSRKLNHVVRDKGASPAQVQKQEEEELPRIFRAKLYAAILQNQLRH